MSAPEDEAPADTRLRGGARLTLHSRGFRHPAAVSFLADVFTPYEEVTHVAVSTRSVRVGTVDSVYILNRNQFFSGLDSERFVGQLAQRVAASPGGPARIIRMREIDHRAALASPQRVTWGFLLLCLLVQVGQLFSDGTLQEAGAFSATAVRAGEYWRLVTANLLHATPWLPIHFVLNGLGLLALGSLLEWTIGSARTALVMTVSGIGAMGVGLWVNYEEAIGASGIVMGVFGALVYLELRHGEELPAHWRLPRAVIWTGIALQAGLEAVAWAFLPIIATGAHIGGFVSGFLVTALVGRGGLNHERPSRRILVANALSAIILVASISGAFTAWQEGPDWRRRAEVLLAHEGVSPMALNNLAWIIATRDVAEEEDLELAQRLAERAVEDTDRGEANILDTLAEVHFRRGEPEEAIEVIEEAIRIEPREAYYLGQRDRFLGRRAADDMPAPPAPRRELSPPRQEKRPLVPDSPEFGA